MYTETRKALPPDALAAFKAAIAVLSPAARGEEIGAMTWEQLKAWELLDPNPNPNNNPAPNPNPNPGPRP